TSISKVREGDVISAVEGGGEYSGNAGDGGRATSAQLNLPYGVSVDGSGNLFIADSFNNRIRKVTAAGVISTVVGNLFSSPGFSGDGGAATSAQVYYPTTVAVDTSGNLFIADSGNNRIRKVTAAGSISKVAG